ncbi:MAG TPA: hypothetical protein VMR86_02780 [Myxococcota bacterium]|nr:hypothetical protein [Myxococcota bacterium]
MKRWTCAVLLLWAACSAGDTPEAAVRRVLGELERAAEARDAGLIQPHLSESYRDSEGNDRRAVLALATGHFLRNRSIHLLTRVSELEVEGAAAHTVVLVAMAGTPIADASALHGVHADLYRFDLRLRNEDGHWRVTSAEWQPASAADFQ